MSQVEDAPRTLRGISSQLGPGLIITASIVGSGELIMTTQVGAAHGFTLLWFIILGCLIKVFVQVELGRYAVVSGETTLGALNQIPGPRFGPSWVVYLWLIMYVCTFVQLAGIVGAVSQVFQAGGIPITEVQCGLLVTLSVAGFLAMGHYKLVERASTWMVALFTALTVLAVVMLARTRFAISLADIESGLKFHLTSNFLEAFAAFGIIGVGASELIYYPYWCLEKGYAVHVGPNDGSAEWVARAQGWMRVMQIDAWASMVVYTISTIAFYLLGAAILHRQGLQVENKELILTLSNIYSSSFGQWGLSVFLVGAFAVLYSTVFISTASNARLLIDAIGVFGTSTRSQWVQVLSTERVRRRWVWWACIGLPPVYFLIWLALGNPKSLVTLGGVSQGLMLPFLSFSAIYLLLYKIPQPLKPGPVWFALVSIAALSITSVGAYSAATEFWKWSTSPAPTANSQQVEPQVGDG